MAIQTDQFKIILKDFDGLYTARDSDDIPSGKSPNLLNVRIAGSHVRGSEGYSLVGERRANPGKILSKKTFKRNDGKQVMVQVRDNGTNAILEWYDVVNDRYYQLLGSLSRVKMGFAEFNTSQTNQFIFCNGIENMSVWSGSTTRLTASVLAGDTTINVEDTTDFPASGTIIYNGQEIAYASKTATTFVVASAHASAGNNDGVAQAADDSTHSAVTKGNILLSAKNRLWIAGQPDAPNALDYSDEGAAFTFTGGSNRADSGTEDFYNIGGRITGLSEKDDEIIVLGEDGADGFSFTYPTATTKAPNFREIFRSSGKGPLSAESVFKVNNEIYFANKSGIASISDLEGTEKIYSKSITRDILPTIKNYDFSESASIWFEKESILLIACKTNKVFPGNDIVLGFEFYKDRDGIDSMGITILDWPVNTWAILEDTDGVDFLYFGSSVSPNSFKAFDTYQNDGAPRTIRYATKRFNYDDPFQNKSCSTIAVRGFIKEGTDIEAKLIHNAGFLGEQTKTIKSDGTDQEGNQKGYVSQSTLNSIGAFALGVNPIGAQLQTVSELKEFTAFLDYGVDFNPKDVQMIFESDTDGGTFMITHVGFAVDYSGVSVEDNLLI